jgi:phosphoribosylaminoimidazole-succinocarboxamide synthase
MSDLPVCCTGSSLHSGIKYTGKVRDTYQVGSLMILVTTDRLSAFDRNLCNVPHKGAVLNLTSAWWMQQTAAICPNALVSVPHPNITVMRACTPFKVEVVVRAYLTGTTSTSVWSHYSKGARTYCGYELPEGECACCCCWGGLTACHAQPQFTHSHTLPTPPLNCLLCLLPAACCCLPTQA